MPGVATPGVVTNSLRSNDRGNGTGYRESGTQESKEASDRIGNVHSQYQERQDDWSFVVFFNGPAGSGTVIFENLENL